MNITLTNKNGITLRTANKIVAEDISIAIDQTNLVSENIKSGKTILGVAGSCQSNSVDTNTYWVDAYDSLDIDVEGYRYWCIKLIDAPQNADFAITLSVHDPDDHELHQYIFHGQAFADGRSESVFQVADVPVIGTKGYSDTLVTPTSMPSYIHLDYWSADSDSDAVCFQVISF